MYCTKITDTSKDVLRFDVEHELRLRGDVLIKCHQLIGDERALLFCCQINTCALDVPAKGKTLVLHKEELDHIFAGGRSAPRPSRCRPSAP
ncbi:hypothetical protein ANCDUO_14302 [Ancylostoma duodenale]|uniref:C2 tensin-type domain-containing protein n=1 Tax=Ancylostoma duodenale TaxID=51022 RepID=A0A0C2G3M1_9BILA|nr:hypothetical protein ANCDUO_14302 [Ancylostoma duodenale]